MVVIRGAPDDDIRDFYVAGDRFALFALRYIDEDDAQEAWERGRDGISDPRDVSVLRMARASGEQVVIVIARDWAGALEMRARVDWGGRRCELTQAEIGSIAARTVHVDRAGGSRRFVRRVIGRPAARRG
jgi:hypothetical protein